MDHDGDGDAKDEEKKEERIIGGGGRGKGRWEDLSSFFLLPCLFLFSSYSHPSSSITL